MNNTTEEKSIKSLADEMVKFTRSQSYKFIAQLGQGACGVTVLLKDEIINELFVCKKYAPINSSQKEELFKSFVKEIKFLYLLNHNNVVRIFNYFLYPSEFTGYIIMERVDGKEIDAFLKEKPDRINDVFRQVIDGFAYLKKSNILHRDIRPQNIMVTQSGTVKIIDFGFGKYAEQTNDYDKSISLNWRYDPPLEFSGKTYTHKTEIYFIGQLFNEIINNFKITSFLYNDLLSQMCIKNPTDRIESFEKISESINENKTSKLLFNTKDKEAYTKFSHYLSSVIIEIDRNSGYNNNIFDILAQLESFYQDHILEEHVLDNSRIISIFINGVYNYNPNVREDTICIYDFIELLKNSPKNKKEIILRNIHSKLNSIPRYEEVPF